MVTDRRSTIVPLRYYYYCLSYHYHYYYHYNYHYNYHNLYSHHYHYQSGARPEYTV